MYGSIKKYKVFTLWFLAIMMLAVHPAQSKESVKEVEDTEEVRLYFQVGKHVKQKPKTFPSNNRNPLFVANIPFEKGTPTKSPLRRYILYCNLIYYQ